MLYFKRDPCQGITPARAGNSDPEEFVDIPMEDHPRACGEQKNI